MIILKGNINPLFQFTLLNITPITPTERSRYGSHQHNFICEFWAHDTFTSLQLQSKQNKSVLLAHPTSNCLVMNSAIYANAALVMHSCSKHLDDYIHRCEQGRRNQGKQNGWIYRASAWRSCPNFQPLITIVLSFIETQTDYVILVWPKFRSPYLGLASMT